MRIGVREIGMRIGLPGLLDDAAGAAQFAGSPSSRAASSAAGTSVGASFKASSASERARSRSLSSAAERARGEQHRALAPVVGLVDQPVAAVAVERRERAAQSPDAQRNSSTACPAQPSDGAAFAASSA